MQLDKLLWYGKPQTKSLIFKEFNQGNVGYDREYEGLGLGLTISRKLVELHGGRMWLDSKVGKGSVFQFTLPLKPAAIPSSSRLLNKKKSVRAEGYSLPSLNYDGMGNPSHYPRNRRFNAWFLYLYPCYSWGFKAYLMWFTKNYRQL